MAYWALFMKPQYAQKAPNHTLQRTGVTVAMPTLLVHARVMFQLCWFPSSYQHAEFIAIDN